MIRVLDQVRQTAAPADTGDLANKAYVDSKASAAQTASVPTGRTIATTAPLAGGGNLTANRTLSIANATTAAKGAVQLSSATNSTSEALAATPKAVKDAYDLAVTANTNANSKAAATHTHSAVSQSVAGFMSAADKKKLDGIFAGSAPAMPQTAVGVGQWLTINSPLSTSFSIPSGGTWAYCVFHCLTGSYNAISAVRCDVVAGGTVLAVGAGYALCGFCWRVM